MDRKQLADDIITNGCAEGKKQLIIAANISFTMDLRAK